MCELTIKYKGRIGELELSLSRRLCEALEEFYPESPAYAVARLAEQHAQQLLRLGKWVRRIIMETVEERG